MRKLVGCWNPKVGEKHCQTRSGRASVEAIVVILIAFVAVGLVAMAMFSGDDESSTARIAGAQQRPTYHHAADVPAAVNPSVVAESPSGPSNETSAANTVIRNGITIISPPLSTPAVNLDQFQVAPDSSTSAGSHISSGGKARSHFAHRTHLRARRAEPRIVGLAAGRRLVTASP